MSTVVDFRGSRRRRRPAVPPQPGTLVPFTAEELREAAQQISAASPEILNVAEGFLGGSTLALCRVLDYFEGLAQPPARRAPR